MKSNILKILLGLCLVAPIQSMADDNDDLLLNMDLAIEEIKRDRENGFCVDRFQSDIKYNLSEVEVKFLAYPLEGLERWKAQYKKHVATAKVKKTPLEFYKTNRLYSYFGNPKRNLKFHLLNTKYESKIPPPCKASLYKDNIYDIAERNKVGGYLNIN